MAPASTGMGEGKTWTRDFIMVSLGGNRQGREPKLGMASLNNSNRLWGVGDVPLGLVPGPGVIKAGG